MLWIKNHQPIIVVGTIVTVLCLWWLFSNGNGTKNDITTKVEIGDVLSTVNVSGYATVDSTILLSFPKGGTVSSVLVEKGHEVATGTILALIGSTEAEANYATAQAEVTRAIAIRDEIQNGQTDEQRAVTSATIASAESALTNTIKNEAVKVETARVTLLSSGLSAVSADGNTQAPAPTVSGSYVCTGEGSYLIEPYRSSSVSGYSFRFEGIENGLGTLYTNQSGPLGTCGLRLQFAEGANYGNTAWIIEIPNTKSTAHAINKATYDQIRNNEEQNIIAAQKALDLALSRAEVDTAGARVETLIAANASVSSAQARLQQVANALTDTAIRAPQSGVITKVDVTVGETVSATPVITLFSPTRVTFTTRIPEIDIRKIALGQRATLSFDAHKEDLRTGLITFISPVPVTIDGVAYFEALITLDTIPSWLRTGMQADVSIVTEKLSQVTKLPIRFVRTTDSNPEVLIYDTKNTKTAVAIKIIGRGTDGNVAIEGVSPGTVVIAP
ncbi:MAG: HlyD family efflux transporter periplasmic adaptor subunit [Candidatus Paceibacteria bacterium]